MGGGVREWILAGVISTRTRLRKVLLGIDGGERGHEEAERAETLEGTREHSVVEIFT